MISFSTFSVKCLQKTVKDSYHIMCRPCACKLEVCAKCGKKEDIVIPWVFLLCLDFTLLVIDKWILFKEAFSSSESLKLQYHTNVDFFYHTGKKP